MTWRDLIGVGAPMAITAPWLGSRRLELGPRSWSISTGLPAEHGWYLFTFRGRQATVTGPQVLEPSDRSLLTFGRTAGYLVGDRLVVDADNPSAPPWTLGERVHLLEPGLERFARVTAGRVTEAGPLVYAGLTWPGAADDAVRAAYADGIDPERLTTIRDVPPSLEAAYRLEHWRRAEVARRRAELAAHREAEAHRAALIRAVGTPEGRRELARVDFEAAARAALQVGGAEYLDSRRGYGRNEYVVQFRMLARRFECVCDAQLAIVDAGICLRDYRSGMSGDKLFTLESLPAVVLQAHRERVLVVLRHVDGPEQNDDW